MMHIVDARRERAQTPASGGASTTVALIDAMLDVAVLHDPTIVMHHNLSSQIAVALAHELKPTPEEVELQADRVSIERHCDAGTRLLAGCNDPITRAAAVIAQTHHERYDGTGYPRKLRSCGIPVVGRIVAVSDSLSALLRARGDRPAFSLAQAIDVVERGSGSQYDPAVVHAVRGNLNEISRVVHETQQGSAQAV